MRRLALVALLVLAACGGGSNDEVPLAQFTNECPDSFDYTAPTLVVETATPPVMGKPVTWHLILTNKGPDGIVMQFNSSQLGDVVLEQGGEEIYRWSRERVFAQSIRCLEMEAGESVRLDLENDILEINPGEYTLTGTVASQPYAPRPVKRTLTVAEP